MVKAIIIVVITTINIYYNNIIIVVNVYNIVVSSEPLIAVSYRC